MPRRDPFADKRKTTKSGKPKQAAKQRNQKANRDAKRELASTKRLKEVTKELSATERKLAIKQHMLELADNAPTPAKMRKIIWATFEEMGFNPVTELIECAQEIEDPKDRAQVVEKLSRMVISNPKSVDIEAEIKGGLTISVMDFTKTTQKDVAEIHKQQQEESLDQAIDVTPTEDTEDPYAEFVADEEKYANTSPNDHKTDDVNEDQLPESNPHRGPL